MPKCDCRGSCGREASGGSWVAERRAASDSGDADGALEFDAKGWALKSPIPIKVALSLEALIDVFF